MPLSNLPSVRSNTRLCQEKAEVGLAKTNREILMALEEIDTKENVLETLSLIAERATTNGDYSVATPQGKEAAIYEYYLKTGLTPVQAAKKLHRSLALLKENPEINALVREWFAENETAAAIGLARLIKIMTKGDDKSAIEAFKALRDPSSQVQINTQVNTKVETKRDESPSIFADLPVIERDIWAEEKK